MQSADERDCGTVRVWDTGTNLHYMMTLAEFIKTIELVKASHDKYLHWSPMGPLWAAACSHTSYTVRCMLFSDV